MNRLLVAPAILAAVSLTACGKSGPTGPTFYKDVQPILTANCTGCHIAQGIAPFELTSYSSAKLHGLLVSAAVQSHSMPPWMPSSDTPPLTDKRALTAAQIATLTSWASTGMSEGDPADATTGPAPVAFHADATLQVPAPYKPDSSLGTDDYHCFVIDPHLDRATAITALNVEPGDRRVVHHVIVYAVDPSHAAALAQAEATGHGNGYTCFGSSGVSGATTVGGWVPGTTSTIFPTGTGVVLAEGTQIVLQVHYNLLTISDTTDQTTAQFSYAAASSVSGAYVFPLVNGSINIPPGEVKSFSKTFDTADTQVPTGVKLKVWGMLPHMHLHGTDIQVSGTHADGTGFMMMHIPKWNFSWQEMYFFQDPIEVVRGDKINLDCSYDNTQANQPVINGMQTTPTTLTWGEDTLSEMCLNFFYATLDY